MPDYVIKTGDREAFITGLRDLADFLSAHPEVLIPPRAHADLLVDVVDPAAGKEGAELAVALLRVSLEDLGLGYFSARRRFGPVAYAITAVPPKGQP